VAHLSFVHALQMYRGHRGVDPAILNLGARWNGEVKHYVTTALLSNKNPGTHGIGGLVGPNVGLEVLGFEPLTLHLIA
jgi:hypothetical protein